MHSPPFRQGSSPHGLVSGIEGQILNTLSVQEPLINCSTDTRLGSSERKHQDRISYLIYNKNINVIYSFIYIDP